ncbi:MAG: tRNA glutamyl-Q(34) synthetase GluQRS [Propionibacteriaceae bacterium]|jgi:glutamyl-tRNA synthetase|nr:tRNA glutamyl-Q(34) synthetase GluQRS [Propionibacteriaceae bacterium]
MNGRYAPSPTSALHLGNLRTALVAWLFARSSGRGFKLRVEDLDQDRVKAAPDVAAKQIADLASLGITFDGEPMWQSDRLDIYAATADKLADRLYECYCTRREIAESASAPHADGYRPYPGTCRDLTESERAERRRQRPPAWRIRAAGASWTIHDFWAGAVTGEVDDFVVRRNDGTWAYNFAVVVDDIAQGVDQVVRGADLLSSAPRQAWLTALLGGTTPEYAHVPLVLGADGERLAKRDGAITLDDFAAQGHDAPWVLSLLGHSLGLNAADEQVPATELLRRFDPSSLRFAQPKVASGA